MKRARSSSIFAYILLSSAALLEARGLEIVARR